jgi:rod shape-determining protein MreC
MPFAGYREEIRLLKGQTALLATKLEEARAVQEENQRLRELLDFRKIVPYSTAAAQVIGRDPSNWSNSLIIDKGANFGIKQNKAVLSTRGLVGRVVEVGRRSSKVMLMNDPNSKVGVLILRNRQGGILVGRPDGRCKMIYIALDSDVKKGDKVITAGFGGTFPKDILVGEVAGVGKEPGRLYKYAIIRPEQDLSKLEEVLCIK